MPISNPKEIIHTGQHFKDDASGREVVILMIRGNGDIFLRTLDNEKGGWKSLGWVGRDEFIVKFSKQ